MIFRGALGYSLVLLGGLVISVIPVSSPVNDLPLVGELRASVPGRMLGLTVVVLGLGLGVASWLRLVRYVARGDRADERARTDLVRRATVLWTAPLLLAPPMFSRDGWSYAAQGEMTRLGLSPYVWTPSILEGPIVEAVDPRWMDTLTPYGPVPLVWGAAAAHLTHDPWLLAVGHRLLAVVGVLLLAYAVPRLASWAGRDGALAAALVLPSPLLLAHGVAGVHNDVVMVGLMAMALVVTVEQRSWVAGAVLGGAAAAVKLPAGLVCIGVALVSLSVLATTPQRVRRLAAVGAVAVATLVLVGVVAGVGWGWVHALGVPGEVRTPLSLTTQVGRMLAFLVGPLDLGVSSDTTVALARTSGSVAALVVAGVVALRAQAGVPAAGVRAVALVMLVVVVLSPVVHHWYLLWCVPLLAVCHLGRRASAGLLHVSWLLALVAPLDSSLEGAGTAIVLAVVLIGAVAGLVAQGHRSARKQAIGPHDSDGRGASSPAQPVGRSSRVTVSSRAGER